ncbi:MAG: CBS domain-containing protein [Desulfobacteraceae bacterium]|nr:CBS domain-containing protein [Desulfobacteraceae bacterium]
MSLKYSLIEIFTNEEARYRERPLYEAVVWYIRGLKSATRCMVSRGIEGCYENGEISTQSVTDISFNMPILIRIILPTAQTDSVLPTLAGMIDDGIMSVREMSIRCHKTRRRLIPRHLRVRDMMTPDPKSVLLYTPVSDVVRLLLSSRFTGVPVLDDHHRPAGVISQGDLIYRGGMPARLGLLAESGKDNLNTVLESLSVRTAEDIMSPAVCIGENKSLTEAVNLMLEKGLKRLPVTDDRGKLTGILSRMDIFRTITEESPDWNDICRNIPVADLKYVSDIMRRDIHTVLPDTPVEDVIRIIDSDDIQRVAVTDRDGRFLGMISDRNLLMAFSDEKKGLWEYFAGKLSFGEKGSADRELSLHLRSETAAEVMKTDTITVSETATIDEAIRLMTEKVIKRLPVLDSEGKFKGMISRESLLRTGFSSS